MNIALALSAALISQAGLVDEVSPLIANGPTSNYRALLIRAPEQGERWEWREMRGASMIDLGHLRRQPDGSYRVPLVFVRPPLTTEPDREIIVYSDATVRCGSDYESGQPRYENAAGPVPLRTDMTWRPILGSFELEMISEIICTPIKSGWVVGRKSREEIVSMFDPATPESEAAERAALRREFPRQHLNRPSIDYPTLAMEREINGRVELSCVVSPEGASKSCEITSEDPPGFGFGQSALETGARQRWSADVEDTTEKLSVVYRLN